MVNIPNSNTKAQIVIRTLAHKFGNFDQVSFFPYDFDFDNQYKPDWGSYEAFGRMDPIMTYKRTTRDISLSFNVVAESEETAATNFNNLQFLINWLYPAYDNKEEEENAEKIRQLQEKSESLKKILQNTGAENSVRAGDIPKEIAKAEQQITNFQELYSIQQSFGMQTIHKSPLFRITFMNLLNEEDYVIAITNFKHKMKFDSADTSFSSKDGKVIPGEFNINMSFKVLHTYTPGTVVSPFAYP